VDGRIVRALFKVVVRGARGCPRRKQQSTRMAPRRSTLLTHARQQNFGYGRSGSFVPHRCHPARAKRVSGSTVRTLWVAPVASGQVPTGAAAARLRRAPGDDRVARVASRAAVTQKLSRLVAIRTSERRGAIRGHLPFTIPRPSACPTNNAVALTPFPTYCKRQSSYSSSPSCSAPTRAAPSSASARSPVSVSSSSSPSS
jgi:hypothetical protein